MVERYAARTGRDVSALPWYVGLGFFKLAVVVAGIVARQRAGAMADNTDDGLAGVIEPLAEGWPGGARRPVTIRWMPPEDHPDGRSDATLGPWGPRSVCGGRSSARWAR